MTYALDTAMDNESARKRILLVDDDDVLKEFLTMILEDTGFVVEQVSNGRQAIRHLFENKIDLILLDMMMPVMDGFQFLDWLRNEEKSDVPVICLTGMGGGESHAAIIDAGASLALRKPAERKTLLDNLSTLLA